MSRLVRWPLNAVIGFLALVGISASAVHYLYEPYNPGFLEYTTIVALHVFMGGAYLALAPFQFVGRVRSRHPGYHRWAGRVLVSTGLVVGATALFLGLVIPFSGGSSEDTSAPSGPSFSWPLSGASSTSVPGGWLCTGSG